MNQLPDPIRNWLFFRLWWRSVSVKRPQAALAILSLLVGAAVISMLLNLYGGVRRKMTQEFRAYGSNVVLAPGSSTSITHPRPLLPSPTGGGNQEWGRPESTAGSSVMDQTVMKSVEEFAGQRSGMIAAPALYGVVRLKRIPSDPNLPVSENVVAVGTDLAALERMNPGWRVAQALLPVHRTYASHASGTGKSASAGESMCAVGARIASRLRVGSGDTVYVEPWAVSTGGHAESGAACHIVSVLTTGSSEDDQVFLPLEVLQTMIGMAGKISLVQLSVPGDTGEIESSIRQLANMLPGVDVRPIRQIVYSEGRVLGVIRWFLLSVTALILVIIAICVMATMTAIVLERRKDIGVMKALGASDQQVMRLFLAEGAVLGMVGGCTGFFIGNFWAYGLAHHLFGVTLNVIWWTLPLVCSLVTLLALGAAVFPVRIVRAIQPAVVLKGE
jgi:putative ABC transport system permease protein